MRRPNVAGTIVQALEQLGQKLVELERRALNGEPLAVAEMTGSVWESLVETGRSAVQVVLDQAARAQPTRMTCTCGEEAESKGFEKTSFVLRFGKVSVERRRMDCGHCGRSWFELDRAWSFPDGRYADDVREASDRLSIRLGSFEEAMDELRYLWGIAPDSTTAHRWIHEDSERAKQAVQQEIEKHSAECSQEGRLQDREARKSADSGFGVVEADGVMVLTWKPGMEPRRPRTETADTQAPSNDNCCTEPKPTVQAQLRHDRHQAPSTVSTVSGSPMGPTRRSERVQGREVLVGLAYLDEDATRADSGRGQLLERRYAATLKDREQFWDVLCAAARQQGVFDKQLILRISDGSMNIIHKLDQMLEFKGIAVVGIVDINHPKQHVWETGHALHPGKKQTNAWVFPHLESIRDGKVLNLIDGLTNELVQFDKQDPKHESIRKLIGYLDRHKDWMNYPQYKDAGYPISSAAVESTNKRLVGRRCKQGGMIWSEVGIEAMIAMRVAFYNPDAWQRLWPHTFKAVA